MLRTLEMRVASRKTTHTRPDAVNKVSGRTLRSRIWVVLSAKGEGHVSEGFGRDSEDFEDERVCN